jgi:hypothetical protein
MERRDQGLPSKSSQMAAEERDYTPAQMRAFIAELQQLVSETDAGESDQKEATDGAPIMSLEQMMSRLRHRQATVAPSHESGTQPRQPPAPSEDAQASAESSREQATEKTGPESNHCGSSDSQEYRRSRDRRSDHAAALAAGQGLCGGTKDEV